jgi:hypothetical protein
MAAIRIACSMLELGGVPFPLVLLVYDDTAYGRCGLGVLCAEHGHR